MLLTNIKCFKNTHTLPLLSKSIYAQLRFLITVLVDLVIFLNFREFPKKIRGILEFANLSSSRNLKKLKPREYYQIYSM